MGITKFHYRCSCHKWWDVPFGISGGKNKKLKKKQKKQKLKETPNFHHRYCPLCILQQIILPDLFTLVHLNYLSRLAILTTLMKSNHSSLGGGLLMLVG